MEKEASCCGCFSVTRGTYILGFFAALSILQAAEDFYMPRFIVNAAVAIMFLPLLFAPTAVVRLIYVTVYVIYSVTNLVFGYYEAQEKSWSEQVQKDVTDSCKKTDANDVNGCIEHARTAISAVILIIFILVGLMSYHFCMTVYRFYKLADSSNNDRIEIVQEP